MIGMRLQLLNIILIGLEFFLHKDIHKITSIANDHTAVTLIDAFTILPPCDVGTSHVGSTCGLQRSASLQRQVLGHRLAEGKAKKRQETDNPDREVRRRRFEDSSRSWNRCDALCSTGWWDPLKETTRTASEDIVGYQKP